jgi:hypothetical protein
VNILCSNGGWLATIVYNQNTVQHKSIAEPAAASKKTASFEFGMDGPHDSCDCNASALDY